MANAYWDVETTNQRVGDPEDKFGTGLRTSEMTGAAAEANMDLDFENFWTATDEYPILQWQVQDVDLSLDADEIAQGETVDATVTLTLDDGSTVTASEVADYDAGGIASVDAGTVDTHAQGTTEVTATVAGESDTATLNVVEPPNIELVDAAVAADAVTEGTSMAVDATYENDGGPGSEAVELTADGATVATDSVFVDSDGRETVEIEWTADARPGERVDVALDGKKLGTVEIVASNAVTLIDAAFPNEIGAGTPYEYQVTLDSDVDADTLTEVTYTLDDDRTTTASVVVDAGGSIETLEHETSAVDPGLTALHRVALGDANVTGTSDIVEAAELSIATLDAPDSVEPGDTVEVTVDVENTGGVADEQTLDLTFDGESVATETVSVDAGETDSVTLEFDAGDGDSDANLTATIDGDEATTTLTVADSETGSSGDGTPGFGVVVALVATTLTAALWGRRTRT